MKKFILITAFLGIFFIHHGVPEDQQVEERVRVVNIEVPVRVVKDGELIGGMKKEDFRLYENKKLQTIHGFNEFRRKIELEETVLEAGIKEVGLKPRLFVLVFNLTDFHLDMEKGIDYLFEKVLRENDQLMILTNNALIPEHRLTDRNQEKERLKSLAKDECVKARQKLLKVVRELETMLKEVWEQVLALETSRMQDAILMRQLEGIKATFERFLEHLIYYKQNYLYPDINKFYGFARYLEKRDIEKWVINFYQLELYPRIKFDSRIKMTVNKLINDAMSDTSQRAAYLASIARGLQKVMTRMDQEMGVGSQFPVEEVSRLFYQVNTTFHTVFMRSLYRNISEDIEYKRIASDIEHSLQEITRLTGGEMITSNDLEQSLQRISEKEDIFYILTYAPKDPDTKKRTIKVELNKKDYKVIYDSTAFPDYFKEFLEKKELEFPDIKIEKLTFKNRLLSFMIGDYKMDESKQGKVEVHIKVVDEKNQPVFNQTKALLLQKKSNNISIRFNALTKGKYQILVELKDLLTGTVCSDNKEVSVR